MNRLRSSPSTNWTCPGKPSHVDHLNGQMQMEEFLQPFLINPNRDWVVSELDKLREEWAVWAKAVADILDHPYDHRTQSDVFADGEVNMKHHEVIQAKTLTFLNNNIKSHGFIGGFDGHGCDRTDLRLKHRVKHRLHSLDELRAALQYAEIVTTSPPATALSILVPQRFIGRLRSFAAKHWQAAAKWGFGIVATVLGAYLVKLLAG